MKADFKDGVSKAAGKLSSLASSVMSSIQVRNQNFIDYFCFLFEFYSNKKHPNIFFIEKIEISILLKWVRTGLLFINREI